MWDNLLTCCIRKVYEENEDFITKKFILCFNEYQISIQI